MSYGTPAGVTAADSSSFKYKSNFFKPQITANNGVFENVKIAVQLKFLSNFWRALVMQFSNCKIHPELNWSKNCIM